MFDFEEMLRESLSAKPQVPSWQWAAGHVDYSRAENYETPYKGMFDPDLMPFWKQPLEDMQDRDCREVVILKCSRAGYSENLVLTDLRYRISRNPGPACYVTGKMELAKDFFDTRICRGMEMSTETLKQKRRAKINETSLVIQFPAMDMRCTWASSDMAKKQAGYETLYCDEFSLFSGFSVDMYRRRCAAYPFHHILFGSSIDPERRGNPDDDPALVLYRESNQCEWYMPDPAGGVFRWELGGPDTPHGIKWDQEAKIDDEWDLNRVAESAYYVTPNGTRIEEVERMAYTRKGKWIASGEGIRRGYKIVAPMVPFSDCSFGELARKFLSAKSRLQVSGSRHDRNRNTLRTYLAEYWARAHREEEQAITESGLAHCEGPYAIGDAPKSEGWQSGIYCTVDVQKHHVWWVARCWSVHRETGEVRSALVDYGNAASFEDLDQQIGVFKPSLVGIDIGYALRQTEVADYCARYTESNPKDSRVIAMRGSDSLKAVALSFTVRDATEGRTNAGGFSPYLEVTWSNDVFRSLLIDDMNSGARWQIPNDWPDERRKAEYVRQVTSTKKVDGEWVPPKHGQDHLWDCEAEQMVLARWDGLI